MSYPPPKVIGHGADRLPMICYAELEPAQRRTAGSSLAGLGPREVCGTAIFEGDGGYYLFECDSSWHVMFDTYHGSVEDAKHQAERQFSGVSRLWKTPKSK